MQLVLIMAEAAEFEINYWAVFCVVLAMCLGVLCLIVVALIQKNWQRFDTHLDVENSRDKLQQQKWEQSVKLCGGPYADKIIQVPLSTDSVHLRCSVAIGGNTVTVTAMYCRPPGAAKKGNANYTPDFLFDSMTYAPVPVDAT